MALRGFVNVPGGIEGVWLCRGCKQKHLNKKGIVHAHDCEFGHEVAKDAESFGIDGKVLFASRPKPEKTKPEVISEKYKHLPANLRLQNEYVDALRLIREAPFNLNPIVLPESPYTDRFKLNRQKLFTRQIYAAAKYWEDYAHELLKQIAALRAKYEPPPPDTESD